MKQFFSQALAHRAQRRLRIPWLAGLPLAMSLWLACIPMASPAFAAPIRANGQTPLIRTTCPHRSDPHNTRSKVVVENDIAHQELFRFTMTTFWCWNGKIVTFHDTEAVAVVSGLGNTVGWRITDVSSIRFQCFVWAKGLPNCSGNQEDASADFGIHNLINNQTCHAAIRELEGYKGQFLAAGSIKCT